MSNIWVLRCDHTGKIYRSFLIQHLGRELLFYLWFGRNRAPSLSYQALAGHVNTQHVKCVIHCLLLLHLKFKKKKLMVNKRRSAMQTRNTCDWMRLAMKPIKLAKRRACSLASVSQSDECRVMMKYIPWESISQGYNQCCSKHCFGGIFQHPMWIEALTTSHPPAEFSPTNVSLCCSTNPSRTKQ